MRARRRYSKNCDEYFFPSSRGDKPTTYRSDNSNYNAYLTR